MIIAMVAVGMVKVSVDQVIDMIAVRNCLVTTARSVDVACIVRSTLVSGRTTIGISLTNRDGVVAYRLVFFLVTQVPFVEIINVPFVFNRRMATIGPVLVIMHRHLLCAIWDQVF